MERQPLLSAHSVLLDVHPQPGTSGLGGGGEEGSGRGGGGEGGCISPSFWQPILHTAPHPQAPPCSPSMHDTTASTHLEAHGECQGAGASSSQVPRVHPPIWKSTCPEDTVGMQWQPCPSHIHPHCGAFALCPFQNIPFTDVH